MKILKKIQSVTKILSEKEGLHRAFTILRTRYGVPIPQSAHSKWRAGIDSEIKFWDNYFATQGLKWPDDYKRRFDSELTLQPRVASLVPDTLRKIYILDVGAGPLTYLGKKLPGKEINIIAVDPLADAYDEIFKKYDIKPLVHTKKATAENLEKVLSREIFDIVFARNCIDHAFSPENAILSMINVVKKNCYVLLEHIPNEAENENYEGLHQWNFSQNAEGDFLITSKSKMINMTKKYSNHCKITSELVYEEHNIGWLITKILKK
jgi:SAM-dependent methyltransferase